MSDLIETTTYESPEPTDAIVEPTFSFASDIAVPALHGAVYSVAAIATYALFATGKAVVSQALANYLAKKKAKQESEDAAENLESDTDTDN